jgi:hypothetical protein
MKVAENWRYPIKSMGGETLACAVLDTLGIAGDRVVHAEDAHGNASTARKHPELLGHHAQLNVRGEPMVDGFLWTDSLVLQQVVDIVGPGARSASDETAHRFDILPLLVATDGAIAAFGHKRDDTVRPALRTLLGSAKIGWETIAVVGIGNSLPPTPALRLLFARQTKGKREIDGNFQRLPAVSCGEVVRLRLWAAHAVVFGVPPSRFWRVGI